jgi:hypothetical protein
LICKKCEDECNIEYYKIETIKTIIKLVNSELNPEELIGENKFLVKKFIEFVLKEIGIKNV